MIYTNAPRHKLPNVVISPFTDEGYSVGMANTGSPASTTWGTANKANFYPIGLLEPFTVAKAWWCNGATVGTDSIDIGVYLMTDPATGRLDLVRSTGAVLSAGSANVVQEAAAWKVARKNLTSGNDSTDATAYTIASSTYKAGRLYLLAVTNTAASAAVVSSVSGGPTFTSRSSTQFNGTAHRVSLWSAVPTVDYTGTLTINYGATQTACVWSMEEFSGVDTSTTDGVVQSVVGTGTSTTPLATLAAFGNANNATFGINANVSDTTTTPGAGFTEIVDISSATPVACLQTQWQVGNDTTSDGTITSAAWGAIAAEIKADASPFVIPPSLPGNPNVYMGFVMSGTTATILNRQPGLNVSMGLALQASSSFPLPSSTTGVSLTTNVRIAFGGFSSRSLLG